MELRTQHSAIRPLLKRIGLTDRECDVYLTLLPLKIARASTVAKLAKQSRSHTYLILRELEERGLVAEVERGKVLHFVAESPDRLLGYVKNKAQELRDLEPIISLFNPQIHEDHLGGNILHILFGKNAKLQGKDLLVNNEAAKRYCREVPPHENYEIRLLPKGITFDTDVIVFEDEITIFTFADEPTTIRIENRALADAFRSWQTVLWNMSTPVPIPS